MSMVNEEQQLQTAEFNEIIPVSLDLLAKTVCKIRLPVDTRGVVNPEFIAQLVMSQKMLEYTQMLEMYKLQETVMWLANHPKPQMNQAELLYAWAEEMCKYLHSRITQFTLGLLKQVQEENTPKSNLIVPNGVENPTILKPRQ